MPALTLQQVTFDCFKTSKLCWNQSVWLSQLDYKWRVQCITCDWQFHTIWLTRLWELFESQFKSNGKYFEVNKEWKWVVIHVVFWILLTQFWIGNSGSDHVYINDRTWNHNFTADITECDMIWLKHYMYNLWRRMCKWAAWDLLLNTSECAKHINEVRV